MTCSRFQLVRTAEILYLKSRLTPKSSHHMRDIERDLIFSAQKKKT